MIYESEEGLIGEGVPRKTKYICSAVFFCAIIAALIFAYALLIGPRHFNLPIDSRFGGLVFEVKDGAGAAAIGRDLKAAGIISSGQMFSIIATLSGDAKRIKQGYYLFKTPTGALEAEMRIAKGDFGIPAVKLTFPEGFAVNQIADRLSANLLFFNKDKFLNIASTSEGYLFPDTYFFMPSDNEQAIYSKMRATFGEKTKNLFSASTTNESDVIKMASILEKEIQSPEDMKIVSGILWKRLKMGMALQVDSASTTYSSQGLPASPIDNPGLNAINAALYPTASPYLYFLTDKDGVVYYAKTFEEHKKNKAKYL